MKPRLHIVTQCTDRKRIAVASHLRLRALRQKTMASRAAAWVAELRASLETVPARDLYAGEHWVTMLDVLSVAEERGFDASLWVASAGLGFVSAGEDVPAYSATFAAGVPDTVLREDSIGGAQQRSEWWECLGTLTRTKRRPSLEDVVKAESSARFLFVVSPAYLQALAPQLERAVGALKDPDQLAIVSSECPEVVSGPLSGHWVPSRAKLHAVVGGTRIGQHARVARRLLESLSPRQTGAASMRKKAEAWLREAPEAKTYNRQVKTDSEVKRFIRESDAASWSRALREFRGSGFACEQKRFRQLFSEARGS